MNKTKIEWADYDRGWLTALIDGEGYVTLLKERRPSFRAGWTLKTRIGISGKCLKVIERARKIIGAGNICRARSQVYTLDISANGARLILSRLCLIEKRKQQLLVIRALKIMERRVGRGLGRRTPAEIRSLEKITAEIRRLNGHE